MIELEKAGVLERAQRIIIGAGLVLGQDADGIATLATDPGAGITQEEADVRYVNLDGDTMTGPLTATSFTGIGTALTALNAANLGSGAVPLARLYTTIGGYGITDFNSLGDARWSLLAHTHTFASLTAKPTTIAGYGITDFNSLGDARWSPLGHTHAYSSLTGIPATFAPSAHTHPWADITGEPTTIGGYGITDFNSLGDARWSLLAHTHAFASLTSKPTTLAGYGITNAVPQQDGTRFTTDLNTLITASGFYNAEVSPPNSPSGFSYGQIIVAKGVDTGLQIAGGYNSDNLWFRGWVTPGPTFYPTAWRKVIHDGIFNSLGDARWSLLAHTHTFASLTSKPTTIGGYGITDFNSLGDARWLGIGATAANSSLLEGYASSAVDSVNTIVRRNSSGYTHSAYFNSPDDSSSGLGLLLGKIGGGDNYHRSYSAATVKTFLNLSGTNTGDQTTITGNAGSATILQTARLINGVSFNGSASIVIGAAWADITSKPTTIGGYGITDFNSLGDARWLLVSGETRHITTTREIRAGAYAGGGHVDGDITARRSATTGVYYFGDYDDRYLYFDGTAFQLSGGTLTATDFTLASDARLKQDIVLIGGALDRIDRLGGYTFRYKRDLSRWRAGVLLQEVREVLPEATINDGVSYDSLIPLLVQGMKELRQEVRELRTARAA